MILNHLQLQMEKFYDHSIILVIHRDHKHGHIPKLIVQVSQSKIEIFCYELINLQLIKTNLGKSKVIGNIFRYKSNIAFSIQYQ